MSWSKCRGLPFILDPPIYEPIFYIIPGTFIQTYNARIPAKDTHRVPYWDPIGRGEILYMLQMKETLIYENSYFIHTKKEKK